MLRACYIRKVLRSGWDVRAVFGEGGQQAAEHFFGKIRDGEGGEMIAAAADEEMIDGIVASIIALDRCLRNQGEPQGSVYDERGLLVF